MPTDHRSVKNRSTIHKYLWYKVFGGQIGYLQAPGAYPPAILYIEEVAY